MPEPARSTGRRETRLLLATIAVSIGMLLLLARFRFPEEALRPAEPGPAPLERLAARATYDELAGIMADLERRVGPMIAVLRVQTPDGTSYLPAVRLAPDRAVALLPRDHRITGAGGGDAPTILARDAVRELVVVQLAPAADSAVVTTPPTRPGPRYLAVAEATPLAPAVRPVYVGRTDLFADPRWPGPVLSVAAVQQTLSTGSAVFSLDGAFIGLAAESGGTVTVVPAETLRTIVAAAPAAAAARGALHIDVQPLTAALARATGADRGVIVAWVPPAAGTKLQSGDVIQSVDGIRITTVAGFQQVEQSRTPGMPVTLEVVRQGEPLSITLTAAEAGTPRSTLPFEGLGAVLRTVGGIGAEVVTVDADSPAARAGLSAADLVIAIDGRPAPDAVAVERAFRATNPGDAMLLTIRRKSQHRIIALEK